MRMIALLAALALAVPAAALADKPSNPGPDGAGKGKSKPHVTYVLRGTLLAYSAATGSADGSVTLLVKGANHHARPLKGQTLEFTLTSTTKVVAHDGAVTLGDRGVVKVRAPKHLATATLAAALQAIAARQLVDQGPTD